MDFGLTTSGVSQSRRTRTIAHISRDRMAHAMHLLSFTSYEIRPEAAWLQNARVSSPAEVQSICHQDLPPLVVQ